MKINQEQFVEWAEKKFDNVKVAGNEVKLPDPWWHKFDNDNAAWVNTEKLCFRAFKSERTGHLIEFVMEIEGCDWNEAIEILGGDDSIYSLEKKLIKLLESEPFNAGSKSVPVQKNASLPPRTFLITSLPAHDPLRKDAEEYLASRCIKPDHLMVCQEGTYKNRIVIPYYGKNGELIYFNTRALSEKAIRYLGPAKEDFGVGKGDVLWMGQWPKAGSKIYITEGEFDAMSLCHCGLYAGACGGKAMSDKQIELLNPYYIVLAFDSDKAGKDSFKIAEQIMEVRKLADGHKPIVSIVRPPIGFKDWNQLLIKFGATVVKMYIDKEEKPCTEMMLTKWRIDDYE